MTTTTGAPGGVPAEQRALVGMARARLAQFVACRDRHIDALALLTEAALHDAVAAGVSIDRLAAELELSPQALASILTRDTALRELHPVGVSA